jgi:hypothetical protein
MLIGLSCSVWIYPTAGEDTAAVMFDGFLNSKRYPHEPAIYGGRLTILAENFYRWFGSLWHGRHLAFTVALTTATIPTGLFLVARHLHNYKRTDLP